MDECDWSSGVCSSDLGEAKVEAGALDLAVPALEPDLAVLEIGLAHHLVQRVQHRDVLCSLGSGELEALVPQHVIFILGLIGPALQAGGEVGRRVRRDLGAEEVERARAPEVERSEERRVGKEGRSRWSPYH